MRSELYQIVAIAYQDSETGKIKVIQQGFRCDPYNHDNIRTNIGTTIAVMDETLGSEHKILDVQILEIDAVSEKLSKEANHCLN